jgi:hypothetical protein
VIRRSRKHRPWLTASYAAARDNTQIAAALAAVSTILIGLEKSLLFREKWKFHLAIATRLSTEEGKRTSRPKLARHPETGETAILCRSADRRGKERAMHDKFSRRIGE